MGSSLSCPQKRSHKSLRNNTFSSSVQSGNFVENFRSLAALVLKARNSICHHSVAAIIALGLRALFLLLVLLSYQRVSSHSSEALQELLTDPKVWDINENLPNNFGNTRVNFSIPNRSSSGSEPMELQIPIRPLQLVPAPI